MDFAQKTDRPTCSSPWIIGDRPALIDRLDGVWMDLWTGQMSADLRPPVGLGVPDLHHANHKSTAGPIPLDLVRLPVAATTGRLIA